VATFGEKLRDCRETKKITNVPDMTIDHVLGESQDKNIATI
jgi:hypothetical protein